MTTMRLTRAFAAVTCAVALAACSSQPAKVVPKPIVRTIAVVAASNPVWYTLENKSALQFVVPLAAAGNYIDSKQKAKLFNARFVSKPVAIGSALTDEVVTRLKGYGYEVVLVDLPRDPESPDSIEIESVKTTADVVLHLRFSEVGLLSPRSTTDYLPRVDAKATVATPGGGLYLYDEEIYYGVDAKPGAKWSIDGDPKFTYPTFEVVMDKVDDIAIGFEAAARLVGARMAAQIHDAVR